MSATVLAATWGILCGEGKWCIVSFVNEYGIGKIIENLLKLKMSWMICTRMNDSRHAMFGLKMVVDLNFLLAWIHVVKLVVKYYQ